ncbi:MAG: hypothetical protein ACLPKE_25475 [Streptosporangiaceae bacterium]
MSKAAASTVIPVTAIGAEKLSIWATSWSRAAPTAQTITAAAAQAIARRTTADAFARKLARPVSHVAFAFPLMTIAAISASPVTGLTSRAQPGRRRCCQLPGTVTADAVCPKRRPVLLDRAPAPSPDTYASMAGSPEQTLLIRPVGAGDLDGSEVSRSGIDVKRG